MVTTDATGLVQYLNPAAQTLTGWSLSAACGRRHQDVLGLAASYVRTGFPLSGAHFTPTHAFRATWEQVGAYEEAKRGAPPSGEVSDHGCLASVLTERWA